MMKRPGGVVESLFTNAHFGRCLSLRALSDSARAVGSHQLEDLVAISATPFYQM